MIFVIKDKFVLYFSELANQGVMISNSSKYALKGVLLLALKSNPDKRMFAKDMPRYIDVPAPYIAKLLQILSKKGIVSSIKGAHGGFFLDKANLDTPLIHIVDAVEDKKRLQACILDIKECDESHPCPMHELIGKAKAHLLGILENTTIADLVSKLEKGESVFPLTLKD